MNNLSQDNEQINIKINELPSGTLLLVRLLNREELEALSVPINIVLTDLNDILLKVFKLAPHYTYLFGFDVIILISKLKSDILEEIVYEIYSKTQLYFNVSYPEVYLNCCIASIDLNSQYNNIEEIYKILLAQIINRQENQYYCHYDDKFSLDIVKAKNIKLNEFRQALVCDEVKFAYQPIIDRKTGEIPYYECLLRMPHKDELVSVGPLIEESEKKGLINVIDRTVLTMAIRELNKSTDLKLSINISNIGILDASLLKFAKNLLTNSNVASRLIVEITETSLNNDLKWTKFFIDSLHELGCKFALDDFGSGFTSFRQLKSLPIDIIKIDGSYIKDILSNNYSQYFVQALIKISEDLGIKTVAEFVENGAVAKYLIDIKIDGMQGNFFCPATNNLNF